MRRLILPRLSRVFARVSEAFSHSFAYNQTSLLRGISGIGREYTELGPEPAGNQCRSGARKEIDGVLDFGYMSMIMPGVGENICVGGVCHLDMEK